MIEEVKKKKRFLARNLCWNKSYEDVINDEKIDEKTSCPLTVAEIGNKLLEKFKEDGRIKYCVFSAERGENQNKKSFHFQGYLEFNSKVDVIAFERSFDLYAEERKGTQWQSINYIKKERSKICNNFFEFGIPKKQILIYNAKNPDIPKERSKQEVLIDIWLSEKRYENFEDLKKDFHHIYVKQRSWLKNLWNEYHPIKVLDVEPASTIWICAPSNFGKTYRTNLLLKKGGYDDFKVSRKKASNRFRPKLWFDLEDENKKVLWIEEIRENFPDFNDVIQLIDKATRLEIKGSHIDNNFELIIFNSLFAPEKIYDSLPKSHQVEILRRLYLGKNSKVYKLVKSKASLKHADRMIDITKNLPEVLKEHLEGVVE